MVTDVSMAPTDVLLSSAHVAEAATNGTEIGTLSAIDPDAGDTHTYTLLDDAGGRFAIQGDKLVVADGLLLDFEQAASHNVTVLVTDAGGLTYGEVLTITLDDVNPETITGDARDNTFVGGAGNDHFVGGGGRDALYGGAGDDTFTVGYNSSGTISGGEGTDRVDVRATYMLADFTYSGVETLVCDQYVGGTFAQFAQFSHIETNRDSARYLDQRCVVVLRFRAPTRGRDRHMV